MILSTTMSSAVERGMRLAAVDFAREVISKLSSSNMLRCELDEALGLFDFEGVSVVSSRSSASKKREGRKTGVVLPFCGEIQSELCCGVKLNHGLHTQCTSSRVGEEDYCKSCRKQADNSATGKPPYGDINDRAKFGVDYRDPKGKMTLPYVNVAEKLGISMEAAHAAAESMGWTIPPEQLKKRVSQRGRPAKTSEPKKKRGRPAKTSAAAPTTQEDQIAQLVAEAYAENLEKLENLESSIEPAKVEKLLESSIEPAKVEKLLESSIEPAKVEKLEKAAAKEEAAKMKLEKAASKEKMKLEKAAAKEEAAKMKLEKAAAKEEAAKMKLEKAAKMKLEKAAAKEEAAKMKLEKAAAKEEAAKKLKAEKLVARALEKTVREEAVAKERAEKKALALKAKQEKAAGKKREKEAKKSDAEEIATPELEEEVVDEEVMDEEVMDEEEGVDLESLSTRTVSGVEYKELEQDGQTILLSMQGEPIGVYDEETDTVQEADFSE